MCFDFRVVVQVGDSFAHHASVACSDGRNKMCLNIPFVAAALRKDVISRDVVARKGLPLDPSCHECIQTAEEVSATSDTVLARVTEAVRSEPR